MPLTVGRGPLQVLNDTRHEDIPTQYFFALHWSISTALANAAGPSNLTQYLFSSIVMFLGLLLESAVMGSAASLVLSLESHRASRRLTPRHGQVTVRRVRVLPLECLRMHCGARTRDSPGVRASR